MPLLQEFAEREPCPALYPVTLASVLVAAKNHEFRRLPNITALLASAVRCSGFGQLLVSCGNSAVVDAELWLISHCRLQVLRPFTDDVHELVEKLRCALDAELCSAALRVAAAAAAWQTLAQSYSCTLLRCNATDARVSSRQLGHCASRR